MPSGGLEERKEVVFSVSDQAQLGSLRDWLRGQHRDLKVVRTPRPPGPNEQGGLDVLTILASSSGIIAAIKVLPEFIRSRRSGFKIEMTVKGEKVIIDATNVEDVLPWVERQLGA
jgi:Effector Associated Constant Component 1